MKRILTLLALAICIAACHKDEVDPDFITDGKVRVVLGDTSLMEYDAAESQISFDMDLLRFSIINDSASQFCTVTLSEMPYEVGQSLYGTILWATDEHGIDVKNNVALEVVRIAGDKVWLWNSNGGIKAVIRVLDAVSKTTS